MILEIEIAGCAGSRKSSSYHGFQYDQYMQLRSQYCAYQCNFNKFVHLHSHVLYIN